MQERVKNVRWDSSIRTRTTVAVARECSDAQSKPAKRKLPILTVSSSPEIMTLLLIAYLVASLIDAVYLAWEALRKFNPLYFLDTSGYA
ncbi:hypothetical protein ISN45_Aa02g002390, partial [Arabidopsis thaliana x Arabidopsis arenosa]